jgi:Family of unknown function (DUF5318)
VARSVRSVIDYSLARRATLAGLFTGKVSALDACDAHPYLLRAAKHHGEPTERSCPVCKHHQLTLVTYVYGDELGEASGRVRPTREIDRLEDVYAELGVYVVEVCQGCSWNHLITSYVVGTGERQPVRRARRRAAEE